MSGTVQWSPKTAFEIVPRYADFTDELAVGEFCASVVSVATAWSGNDPTPAIIGTSTIINNTAGIAAVVQVNVQNGVLGTIYQVVMTCLTNQSHTITKSAVIAIIPPVN